MDATWYNAFVVVDTATRTEVQATYQDIDRVNFQYTMEEFGPSGEEANWEEVPIIGRSEPFQNYANTAARSWQITFEFYAQGLHTENLVQAINDEVMRPVHFLESLKFPVRKGNGMVADPATCFLIIGNLVRERVICISAEPRYKEPFEPTTFLPMYAQVECEFRVVNQYPREAYDVLTNKHAVGLRVTPNQLGR
jgi:hypothetical protein